MLCNTDHLKEWLGFKREADVTTWLNEHHIKWWPGKGGQPCTTEEQINASFNGKPEEVKFT